MSDEPASVIGSVVQHERAMAQATEIAAAYAACRDVEALMARFGVSRRTIFRAVQRAGAVQRAEPEGAQP